MIVRTSEDFEDDFDDDDLAWEGAHNKLNHFALLIEVVFSIHASRTETVTYIFKLSNDEYEK
jgi:hypothetical protein